MGSDTECYFQAQDPVQQLELITELLGTPSLEDMRYACEGAKSHMLLRARKPPSLTALYTLSSQATHEVVHLLCQMLVFDPVNIFLYIHLYRLHFRCENVARFFLCSYKNLVTFGRHFGHKARIIKVGGLKRNTLKPR